MRDIEEARLADERKALDNNYITLPKDEKEKEKVDELTVDSPLITMVSDKILAAANVVTCSVNEIPWKNIKSLNEKVGDIEKIEDEIIDIERRIEIVQRIAKKRLLQIRGEIEGRAEDDLGVGVESDSEDEGDEKYPTKKTKVAGKYDHGEFDVDVRDI